MEFKTWLLYFITTTVLSIVPGPTVIFVSAQGLKYGVRSGTFAALGTSFADLVYFILSALGLGAFILSAGHLFGYIKIGGAIYLVISGGMIIYQAFKNQHIETPKIKAGHSDFKSFPQGCITELANPKAILFFIALLPQFITPHGNVILQLFLMALTTIVPEIFILILYAWVAAKSKTLAGKNATLRKWLDLMAGSILVGLGIDLFLLKDNK